MGDYHNSIIETYNTFSYSVNHEAQVCMQALLEIVYQFLENDPMKLSITRVS